MIGQYEAAMRQPADAAALAARVASVRERADLPYLQDDMVDLVNESMDGLKRVRDIVQALKDFRMWARRTGRSPACTRAWTAP
jgi:hypothetical protein